jgi:hypothetical protein
MLVLSLSAAQAQETPSLRAFAAQPSRPLLTREAPAPERQAWDDDFETRAWGGLYLNKSGLEIRQPMRIGKHELELGVKGPLMKRERVGLAFELRF